MRATPDGRRPAVERAAFYAREPRLLIGEALIHQLDVLRYLAGPLRVVAARALRTEPGLPGETVATLLLELAGARSSVVMTGTGLELRGAFEERLLVEDAYRLAAAAIV